LRQGARVIEDSRRLRLVWLRPPGARLGPGRWLTARPRLWARQPAASSEGRGRQNWRRADSSRVGTRAHHGRRHAI